MYIPSHDCLGVLTIKISLHQLEINIFVHTYSYKYICKYVNIKKIFRHSTKSFKYIMPFFSCDIIESSFKI